MEQPEIFQILTEVISSTVSKLESEEGLVHKSLALYILNSEKTKDLKPYLEREFNEVVLESYDKNSKLCEVENLDIVFKIPNNLDNFKDGLYRIDYQSRIENVFGYVEFTINTQKDGLDYEITQKFITSIGR